MMKHSKMHYAWIILLACCFIQFGGTGILTNCGSVFMPYVCRSVGLTTSEYSMFITMRQIFTAFFLPLSGKLIMKMSPKILLTGAGVLVSGAFAMTSIATAPWQWYLCGAGLGIGGSFLFMTLSPIILHQWFKDRSGFVIGIAMAFSGVGGAVMSPVSALLIEWVGWQQAAGILAGISFMCIVPFTLFVLCIKPEDMGLEPYVRDNHQEETPKTIPGTNNVIEKRNLWKQPIFYLVLFIAGSISFAVGFDMHIVQYTVTLGRPILEGAAMASALMIGNIVFKLLLGILCDKITTGKTIELFAIIIFCGFFLLFNIAQPHFMLLWFIAFCLGGCMSLTAVGVPLLVADFFHAEYTMALSCATMVTMFVLGLSTLLCGNIFDLFGSYHKAILLAAILYLLVAILVFIIYKRRKS